MKKISINFSGALRTFVYCAESIKKNIIDILKEEYDVYMFGHFWILNENNLEYKMKWKKDCTDSIESINKFKFNQYCIEEYSSEWEKNIIKECDGEEILEEYSKISDQEERVNFKNYAVNCMGMYFKIKKCQELMEKYENDNNIKFDYVIRMRPDFYWNQIIPLGLINKLNDNNILLVKDSYCIRAKWNGNDKFFMCNSNVMKKYSRIYDKIKYFYDKKIRVEGQNMAKYMIEDLGLEILFYGDEETYDKATGKFVKNILKNHV